MLFENLPEDVAPLFAEANESMWNRLLQIGNVALTD